MTLRVGASFGCYDVLPLEGRGGMAEVYRARDTRLNREVVLKVLKDHRTLDERSLARLRREAHLLASLNHPNIAAIYGIEEHDGIQALVLELVEGPTLADRISQGPLPVDQALRIARQVTAALEAAHDHGIVHRDVKPSNIKLRADGTVKVLDFGLAAVDPSAIAADQVTLTVTALMDGWAGTTPYMSPEQVQGHPVDKRTDIWAFGCVLYEMLTGGRPFEGANAAQTIAAIVSHEPRWDTLPPTVPASCRAVLERCLRKNPADRIRDVGDVHLALDGAFAPDANLEPPGSARPASWVRWPHLLPWLAVAAAAGVAIVGFRTTSSAPLVAPITFELHAPKGGPFYRVTMEPYPALSPDGRRLAFVAEWEARRALWVQTIGALEAFPLPGTAGASAPFWSPDGQFIGFLADGRLKKVALAGDRPVQTLSEVPARFGGTWTAAGTVVFAGSDGLYRVGSEGGESVRLTRLDELRGEFSHRWPVAVPGSTSLFAYLIRSTEEDARGIYLASLDDPSVKRRLVADDSNSAFTRGPNGDVHFFFVHDSTLLAQPFDGRAGRLTSAPVLVARPVAPGETGRLAPFAVAGTTLVYRPAAPSPNRMVWVDRHGERGTTVGDASTEHRYLTLSPDGASLAVAEVDAGTGRLDIWVVDLRRNIRERLTRDPVGALFPVWKPDSRNVVYASGRGGVFDLYSQAASASAEGQVLYRAALPIIKYPTDVTRDGRHVVFQSDGQIFRLSVTGDGSVLPLARGIQGRVSPNGRWLAFTSTETAVRQVYVTTFPQATERWRISTATGEDPQWRRDGSELYYIEAGGTLTAVPVRPTDEFAIGPPRSLFRVNFPNRAMALGPVYAASHDGQRFLVLETERDDEMLLRVTTNWAPGAVSAMQWAGGSGWGAPR